MEYLIEKIKGADFEKEPFEHIYIENFFSDEDFKKLISEPDILLPTVSSDGELMEVLASNGYKVISFPGCIVDVADYLKWHSGRSKKLMNNSACEGFGMTFRLTQSKSEFIQKIQVFLASQEFNSAIAEKFGIDFDQCNVDGGIHKYLDGYEISPHPDIRRKAATFMVNINPHIDSELLNYHTNYMLFNPNREYVQKFWEGNSGVDRCWVPWDWCKTVKEQRKNNSIVLFSPSNDTIHSVKADYDHLAGQRTQLYGNLWYKEMPDTKVLEWESLDLHSSSKRIDETLSFSSKCFKSLPSPVQKFAKRMIKSKRDVLGRNY